MYLFWTLIVAIAFLGAQTLRAGNLRTPAGRYNLALGVAIMAVALTLAGLGLVEVMK